MFFKRTFWWTSIFLWGQWYPCFGLLVTSALGFKVRLDPHCSSALASSDSPQVRLESCRCHLASASKGVVKLAWFNTKKPESFTYESKSIHCLTRPNSVFGPLGPSCVLHNYKSYALYSQHTKFALLKSQILIFKSVQFFVIIWHQRKEFFHRLIVGLKLMFRLRICVLLGS